MRASRLPSLLSQRCGLDFGLLALRTIFSWASQFGLKVLVGDNDCAFVLCCLWLTSKATLNATENPLDLIEISKPSMKTCVAVPLFVIASLIQHECHEHLASLRKYTLPSHPFFRNIVCPHYTSECLLYIAIAIVAAPQGQTLNRTILAGLCFVISNLGVTADSTRKWYVAKFGADNLKGRWRMLPYVY